MKKLIFILFLLLSGSLITTFSQVLNSQGKIENNGKIIIKGQAVIKQDTLGGRVEFDGPDIFTIQYIPQITYSDLYFGGIAKKYLTDTSKYLTTLNNLETKKDIFIRINNGTFIYSNGTTNHNAQINPDFTFGKIILNGNVAQDIFGKGLFKELELNNPSGADVKQNGGFRIDTRLELTKGEFRNSKDSNFTMSDQSLIVRHVGASLSEEPSIDNRIDVKYVGDGSIVAGAELPTDSTKLRNVYVYNTQGITLSKDVTVNDTLALNSDIRTEADSNNKYTLTSTSLNNPIFNNKLAEINGSFRRTALRYDSTNIVFNNIHTYALFSDTNKSGGAKELTFRVKPRTFPPFLQGSAKVKRFINITAKDMNFNPIQFGLNMTVGYGWRNTTDSTLNENNGLEVAKLRLQRWVVDKWTDVMSSEIPNTDSTLGWSYSQATSVTAFGDFGIGLPGGLMELALRAGIMLEGAYRFNGKMGTELRDSNLIPFTPPDIYPYNLDPKRSGIAVTFIPDSVVDWIVVEFRNKISGIKTQYVTCFVRNDGKLIDLNGKYPINLFNQGIDSGEYYIAIRHRNHLGLITENTVSVYPESSVVYLDFTKSSLVLGRTASVKPLDVNPDGSLLFGMFAGDVNGDGVIDQNDLIMTWEDRDYEGYFTRDNSMNGIITTKDFNYSWNNRGKKTQIP